MNLCVGFCSGHKNIMFLFLIKNERIVLIDPLFVRNEKKIIAQILIEMASN